jgi:hypothetical protein
MVGGRLSTHSNQIFIWFRHDHTCHGTEPLLFACVLWRDRGALLPLLHTLNVDLYANVCPMTIQYWTYSARVRFLAKGGSVICEPFLSYIKPWWLAGVNPNSGFLVCASTRTSRPYWVLLVPSWNVDSWSETQMFRISISTPSPIHLNSWHEMLAWQTCIRLKAQPRIQE